MKKIKNLTVMAATAAILIPASGALATDFVDLSETGTASGDITAAYSVVGTSVIHFERANNQPTGTGVFDPFLTLDSKSPDKAASTGDSNLEQGYNTTTDNSTLPLDDLRDHWNKNVQIKDLKNLNGFYVFELDANETGNGSDNRFLSIDNIRLYTSPEGSKTTSDISQLGSLRIALNDPNVTNPTTPVPKWVLIDSTRNTPLQKTSGSGSSDMYVYIPADVLAGVDPEQYVYFYNLNGLHYAADGYDGTAADAGYEEWAALTGPNTVPDGGNTLALLGSALTALGFVAGRRKLAVKA
jgi:hypothetical protein